MVLGVLALVAISIARFRMTFALSPTSKSAALALLACCICATSGCHRETPRATRTLPAVQLIDDHGHPIALGSLRGKVVLLDFIHIGCPGVCDNLINKFGQVADRLRPELGSKVMLVSITNDPDHDRPELLLKLARDMQADVNGWLFLTGSAEDVDLVINAFGVDNKRLPDGSPNHITRVFMLGPDMRQRREYPGMAMDSRAVASEIMNQIGRGGAS